MRPRARLEKHEQADGVRLLQALGGVVYVLGTRRRRGDYPGTMQTPGIADVEAFLPCRATPGRWVLLKWEVKRSAGGRMRPEQVRYRELCERSDTPHVAGDLTRLMVWLARAGYLAESQVGAGRLALMREVRS